VFAWCLFGLGTLELLSGGGVSGVWAVLLGWFVLGAATTEETRAVVEQELAGVRVRDIMTPDPVVAPDSITVDELLDQYVLAHRCTSFPITSNGSVTGLATLARCRAVLPRRRAGTPVRDVAWPMAQVAVARPDELVVDVEQATEMGGSSSSTRIDLWASCRRPISSGLPQFDRACSESGGNDAGA
jgi:hypothetical protein